MRLLALGIALGAALPAFAQSEALVRIGSNAAGAELSVDRNSLKTVRSVPGVRGFEAVQIWAVYDLQGVRRDPARSERALYSFNCRARTINTLAYSRYRANGTRLHDWKAADLDFKYEPVKVGTLAEQAMEFACNGGKLPTPVVQQDMGGLVKVDDDAE